MPLSRQLGHSVNFVRNALRCKRHSAKDTQRGIARALSDATPCPEELELELRACRAVRASQGAIAAPPSRCIIDRRAVTLKFPLPQRPAREAFSPSATRFWQFCFAAFRLLP